MIGWISLGNVLDQQYFPGFNGAALDLEIIPESTLTIEITEGP